MQHETLQKHSMYKRKKTNGEKEEKKPVQN